ncbi:MAG TPA: hypothetical protein DCM62_07770 [Bacteroidales bacterium]|nr:hypothetical protein [Bacteroidales bacterium]
MAELQIPPNMGCINSTLLIAGKSFSMTIFDWHLVILSKAKDLFYVGITNSAKRGMLQFDFAHCRHFGQHAILRLASCRPEQSEGSILWRNYKFRQALKDVWIIVISVILPLTRNVAFYTFVINLPFNGGNIKTRVRRGDASPAKAP